MVNATFSCEIAAGKRAVDAITFLESDLEKNGITAITDVELSFHIFDSETWNTTVDTGAIPVSYTHLQVYPSAAAPQRRGSSGQIRSVPPPGPAGGAAPEYLL